MKTQVGPLSEDVEPASAPRIFLSPPHLGDREIEFVKEAFESNWIAPLGPQVSAFEREAARYLGIPHALAVSSGTAALHLALRLLDVGPGDEVLCSTFTFVATATPILYQSATPVFIDSEERSWNIDPALIEEELEEAERRGKLPKAVVVADIFGQSADYVRVLEACGARGVPVIEDAAEAMGATYGSRPVGGFGKLGVFSFNGNKIITTSGGGLLVSAEKALLDRARFLATQARDLAPHYQHSVLGYNYRMSNVLAAIGRGQLRVLDDRIAARRRNFEIYASGLGDLPGLEFMPEAPYGRTTRWLTCVTIEPEAFGAGREDVRMALEAANIESRPLWKPMHLQPLFRGCRIRGGQVAERIFERGLCLPSGSNLTRSDLERIISTVRNVCPRRGFVSGSS